MADAQRHFALAGRSASESVVTVTPTGPAWRVSLRARPDAVAGLSKALGLTLPERPKTSAEAKSRAALWLGPDEWYLLDEANDPLADLAEAKILHSAVDISHRNVGIRVEGPGAVACLSAGCPQNLSLKTFPVGAASRTILGKSEIVLWRTGVQAFRVECWRSFSTYVMDFLEEAALDAGA